MTEAVVSTGSRPNVGRPEPPLTVYGPVGARIPRLRTYAGEIWLRRAFMRALIVTDLKAKHYDTFFGQAWLVLNPILQAAVWLLVREVIRPAGTDETRSDIIAHLVLGLFMFQYMSGLVTSGVTAIVNRKRMILNTSFPRGLFIAVDLAKGLIELGPTMLVYLCLMVVLGQPFTWYLVWFIPITVLLTFFALGLMMGLGTLQVYFRDTQNFIGFIMRLWLFCSPILFKVSEIPDHLLPYLQLNPLFGFFAAYEQIFDGTAPDPKYLLWGFGWALLTCTVGGYAFLRKERDFATSL